MLILDSQVHTYERDHPGRPWHGVLPGPAEVTGEQMVQAMDEAGVDGAILVSALTMYRYDPSYAVDVYRRYPGRFALIKPVDPSDPGVVESIKEWKMTPGTVGIRMLLVRAGLPADPADPGINKVLETAARLSMPINLHIAGRLDQGEALIRRHPDTRIVVDHLGLVQPMEPPKPAEPWAELDQVLALAKYPNVAMKITGACTLSLQSYPYPDIWGPVCRMIDAFGISRCMWGTDWTRAVAFLTYKQGVDAFLTSDRFTPDEKARLMSGTLTEIYGWSPPKR